MDPETRRAWRRLLREVREKRPLWSRIGKRRVSAWPGALFCLVRGFRSLTGRAKQWELHSATERR